ncbi:hypothetical protein KAR91_59085 [Candidatus Pacearchaeota archaeon]|nr:hypothetical protein [Candidatus Pacearchaeota archaeon]
MIHNLYEVDISVHLIEGEKPVLIKWCTIYLMSDNEVNAYCDAVQYCQNRLSPEYRVNLESTMVKVVTRNECFKDNKITSGGCIFVEIDNES